MKSFPYICILFCMLSLTALPLSGQESLRDEIREQMLELLDQQNENPDLPLAEYEELEEILLARININELTAETLSKLPFITAFQSHSFLRYKNRYGTIYSINELYLITGFHPDLIEKFAMVFDFENPGTQAATKTSFREASLRHRILCQIKYELPQRLGFRPEIDSLHHFLGSPVKRLIKYELKKGSAIKAGFSLESDAGEVFGFDSLQKGFNFQSAYLMYKGNKIIEKAIIGDFRLNVGEGMLYSSFRNSKSTLNQGQYRVPDLKKYSSTGEYGYFRGAGLVGRIKDFRIIAFLSSLPLSRNLKIRENGSLFFSSLTTNSLFRNYSERQKYHNTREESAGLVLARSKNNYQLGYSLRYTGFSHEYEYNIRGDPYSPVLYRRNMFFSSLFYSYRKKMIMLTGEFALQKPEKIAFQQRMHFSPHPLYQFLFAYRYHSPGYDNPIASGLSESSSIKNEKGFFSSLNFYPYHFLKLESYLDIYEYCFIDYNSNFPIKGREFRILAEWTINNGFVVKTKMSTETKDVREAEVEKGIKKMEAQKFSSFYLQYTWQLNKMSALRFRYEQKFKNNFSDGSSLIFQEWNYKSKNERIKFNLRYTLFDAPDWSLRIYSWEHDVLYSMSMPSFYKTGQRIFLNLSIKSREALSFGCKASLSRYPQTRSGGNSFDYREGKNYFEIKGQWILKI